MPDKPDPDLDRHLSRQARLVAFVIAGTAVLWVGAQWLGGRMGWETRFAFLFDLAAIAAFIWAMAVTYRIWRQRRT
jgi:Family of unknown function (DUF5337)